MRSQGQLKEKAMAIAIAGERWRDELKDWYETVRFYLLETDGDTVQQMSRRVYVAELLKLSKPNLGDLIPCAPYVGKGGSNTILVHFGKDQMTPISAERAESICAGEEDEH